MSQRWIIIGDSLVTSASPFDHAKESLAYHLMHSYNVNVSLLSSGGQTMTGQACQKLPQGIEFIHGPLQTVDKIIIALGTNDWAMDLFDVGISRETFKDHYIRFLEAIPQDLDTYALTPLTRADEQTKNLQGWPLSAYRDDISEVCSEFKVNVLDGSKVFSSAEKPYFMEDGIHLTPSGTRFFADWLGMKLAV